MEKYQPKIYLDDICEESEIENKMLRELLKECETAFNYLEEASYIGGRFKTTYELVAEIGKKLK